MWSLHCYKGWFQYLRTSDNGLQRKNLNTNLKGQYLLDLNSFGVQKKDFTVSGIYTFEDGLWLAGPGGPEQAQRQDAGFRHFRELQFAVN